MLRPACAADEIRLGVLSLMWLTGQVVMTGGWQSLLEAHGLADVAGVFASVLGERVAGGGSSEVRRLVLSGPDGSTRCVYLKKYWIRRPRQLWSGMLRGTFFGRSKVRQEYENLVLLRACGLGAPTPVAFGEFRRVRWLLRSFLITEGVPQAVPLDEWIRNRWPAMEPREARRVRAELLTNLAEATRRMHDAGFVHHDYFWRNIILSGTRVDTFHLIDAHKGRRRAGGLGVRHRVKDLACLDAPAPWFFRRSERLRFYLRYAGQDRLTGPDKALIRQVLALAHPMRERQVGRVRSGS